MGGKRVIFKKLSCISTNFGGSNYYAIVKIFVHKNIFAYLFSVPKKCCFPLCLIEHKSNSKYGKNGPGKTSYLDTFRTVLFKSMTYPTN